MRCDVREPGSYEPAPVHHSFETCAGTRKGCLNLLSVDRHERDLECNLIRLDAFLNCSETD